MVNVKDIENVLETYMLSPDVKFSELKPYLTSEFEWNVDQLNETQFMIRGIVIEDDMIISELLKTYLPMETIILREI